jgi:DNA-binding response OmpR family regulator
MPRGRLLVLDDEPRILDIVKYFLEQGGYDVEAYADPDQGVAAANRAPFDVAVIDVILNAGRSGYDVAGRLKKVKNTEQMPVLFMSSKVQMADLFLENYDGRAEFILKPFKKDDLLAKVETLRQGGGRQARRHALPRKD